MWQVTRLYWYAIPHDDWRLGVRLANHRLPAAVHASETENRAHTHNSIAKHDIWNYVLGSNPWRHVYTRTLISSQVYQHYRWRIISWSKHLKSRVIRIGLALWTVVLNSFRRNLSPSIKAYILSVYGDFILILLLIKNRKLDIIIHLHSKFVCGAWCKCWQEFIYRKCAWSHERGACADCNPGAASR